MLKKDINLNEMTFSQNLMYHFEKKGDIIQEIKRVQEETELICDYFNYVSNLYRAIKDYVIKNSNECHFVYCVKGKIFSLSLQNVIINVNGDVIIFRVKVYYYPHIYRGYDDFDDYYDMRNPEWTLENIHAPVDLHYNFTKRKFNEWVKGLHIDNTNYIKDELKETLNGFIDTHKLPIQGDRSRLIESILNKVVK